MNISPNSSAATPPWLVAQGISRTFHLPKQTLFGARQRLQAVKPVSFEIQNGQSLGIIGESGSGKSTLTRILLGLDSPTTGTVSVAGRQVDSSARPAELRWLRKLTGVVFQDPSSSLDPRMSVGRLIAEPLWALEIPGNHRQQVLEILEQVGLDPEAASRYPHEFSGGQRQRIAIARAIVHKPKMLVGDEPLSALDISTRVQIMDLLRNLQQETGLMLLMVSHDIGVVQQLCDSVLVMQGGEVVEQGSAKEVLGNPKQSYTRDLLNAIPTLPSPTR